MKRRLSSEAVSPIIGFVIATVLFSVSFYYIVDTAVTREADTSAADTATYFESSSALANIVMTPGVGWFDGASCTADGARNEAAWDPEGVGAVDGSNQPLGRFGLGDDLCQASSISSRALNNLSFEKFRNIHTAEMEIDSANGHLDYEEARRSLGLAGRNLDFHLRSWPVLASTVQLLKSHSQDPNMRPLYVGNYDHVGGGGGLPDVPHVVGLAKLSDRIIVYVNITNDGVTDTAFDVALSMKLKKDTPNVDLHTGLLGNGEVGRVELTILKTKGWEWKNAVSQKISYVISDRVRAVGSGDIPVDVAMTYGSTRPNLFIESGALSYTVVPPSSNSVNVYYAAYDGKGELTSVAENQWKYVLLKPDGSVHDTYDIPAGSSGSRSMTVTDVGDTYTAELRTDDGVTLWNQDAVLVHDEEVDEYYTIVPGEYEPTQVTLDETRFIDTIVLKFDRASVDSHYDAPPEIPYDPDGDGDVFPADKQWIADHIEAAIGTKDDPTLANYDTIVVGSDVDQTVLNTGDVKWAIKAWVELGGTLLVFGKAEGHSNWLEPVWGTTVEGAGTGLHTPDSDHPSLNVPNRLDFEGYIPASEWDPENEHFTSIVETDTGDLLTVSDPGSVGAGRVVLSGWRPGELTADQATTCPDPLPEEGANCQALFFIHNLLTISYRDLYLDYGPAIPETSSTGSQFRIVSVYHPELMQLITVQLQIWVFAGGG